MSFNPSSTSGTVRITITGLKEIIAAQQAMIREIPTFKMNAHRDASTFFVLKAKERVHKISGNLARSIKVDSITPQQAIVSANMPYAQAEEKRPGRRRIAPGTPHAYMAPAAAVDTGKQMPVIIKKRFDELLAKHRTR